MSTYLLTLIIGLFEVTQIEQDGILVRGYCPVGFKKAISHFVELAAESIVFYEQYFGLPYPLKKLDLVACHSLNVRAMENWGCITFLRSVILTDPDDQPSLLF
jgi:aminopeptidase N